jgi:hypothetical protein
MQRAFMQTARWFTVRETVGFCFAPQAPAHVSPLKMAKKNNKKLRNFRYQKLLEMEKTADEERETLRQKKEAVRNVIF